MGGGVGNDAGHEKKPAASSTITCRAGTGGAAAGAGAEGVEPGNGAYHGCGAWKTRVAVYT